MSSDEEFSDNGEKTSQFKNALVKLQGQLEDFSFTKRTSRNLRFSLPLEDDKPKQNVFVKTSGDYPLTKRIEISDHDLVDQDCEARIEQRKIPNEHQSDTSQEIERISDHLEQDALQSDNKLEDIMFKIHGINNLVKTFQGTKDSKQFRHLEASLVMCQIELDDFIANDNVDMRQEKKRLSLLIKETLSDLYYKADCNLTCIDDCEDCIS